MRRVLSLLGAWLHLSASIYIAFALFWLATYVFQPDEGDSLTVPEVLLGAAVLAMQAGLSAVYVLPFVPFRRRILTTTFSFIRSGYAFVVIWIAALLSALWLQAEASMGETLGDRAFWEAVLKYEFVGYLAVVIWALSRIGWNRVQEQRKISIGKA